MKMGMKKGMMMKKASGTKKAGGKGSIKRLMKMDMMKSKKGKY